jgi:hypothetical protein
MSGGRKTESFYGIKTREIVVQNADGTFPPVGTVLTIVDDKGHTVWSPVAPAVPKIRYFSFVNQNATDPVNAALTWPISVPWPEAGQQVDDGEPVPNWICSVVGISYNYTSAAISLRQLSGLCFFVANDGWYINRTMIDAFGFTSGFMGFHIMAVPAAMADDRR